MNDPSVCPSGITVDGIVLDRWIGKLRTFTNIFHYFMDRNFPIFCKYFSKEEKAKDPWNKRTCRTKIKNLLAAELSMTIDRFKEFITE